LFLDPDGEAIKAREREEEYPPGFLADLTRLNIQLMTRLRDRLPEAAQERLRLAVYDETLRSRRPSTRWPLARELAPPSKTGQTRNGNRLRLRAQSVVYHPAHRLARSRVVARAGSANVLRPRPGVPRTHGHDRAHGPAPS